MSSSSQAQQIKDYMKSWSSRSSGSFASVFRSSNGKKTILLKIVMRETNENRKQVFARLESIENILNKMDPEREIFGAKIVRTYFPVPIGDRQYTGIFMPDNGISLDKIKLKDYECIRNAIPDLLRGLDMLATEQLIHGDIKSANIVWDGRRLRLIDFDFLHSFQQSSQAHRKNCETKIKSVGDKSCQDLDFIFVGPDVMRNTIDNFYFIWPLDRFYNPLNDRFMFDASSDISMTNLYYLMSHCLHAPRQQAQSMYRFLTQKTIRSCRHDWVRAVIDFYSSPCQKLYDPTKFDIYSLGLTLMSLPPMRNDPNHSLIMSMIHPDPSHRPTPSDAQKRWIYCV